MIDGAEVFEPAFIGVEAARMGLFHRRDNHEIAEVQRGARVEPEGATNVVRHSDTRHCSIALQQEPRSIAVEVADDGRSGGERAAFTEARAHRPDSPGRSEIGLRGLAELAALDVMFSAARSLTAR
jgi:hypothetical protein